MEQKLPYAIKDGPSCVEALQILPVGVGYTSCPLTALVARMRRLAHYTY
jgi:hypothetical protein